MRLVPHTTFSFMPAIAALLPALAQGCATAAPHATASPAEHRPLSVPVVLIAGDVEVRTGEGAFARLAEGAPAANVAEIRVEHGGAVVLGSADDPRAKLWLRADSSVRLGEDDKGALTVSVMHGEARARSFVDGSKLSVLTAAGAAEAPQGDVLIVGGETMVPTSEDPRAADWALGMEDRRPPAAAGFGSLEARTTEDKSAKLALTSVHVSAEVAGDLAETRVEHVFHNDGGDRLEGTFRFPLPEEASLVGLSMEIDGRMMEGELVEIDKARRTFEAIVDEMRDPALLEWEHGSTFKLRVFPIEPRSDKRIVIRYVAPLRRDAGRYEYVYPTAAPDMTDTIGAFRLDFQGKTVVSREGFRPGGEIAVPVPDALRPGEAVAEQRDDGTYTAVHLRPRWADVRAKQPAPAAPGPRSVIAVFDTSRSSLESRDLALDALRAVLAELGPRDRFQLVAADVDQTDQTPELAPATPAAEAAAIRFLEGVEPDGASDIGGALRHAGKLAARAKATAPGASVQVVYVGDGSPTWGETTGEALHRVAIESLGDAPLFAVLLGTDVNAELMRDLTGIHGGWIARPRSPVAARRFALQLAHAGEVATIEHAHVEAGDGNAVGHTADATMMEGDDLVAIVRTPKGSATPTSLKLAGKAFGQDVSLDVPVPAPALAKHVARRWAALEIAALEKQPDKKAEVVKMSLDYQVMSKQTAFLVLESEEAYARYQIERKQKAKQQADGKPVVSGGDLESVTARSARMGMDRIQPGDPEIHIPAPADAQRVVVVFPFGETKVAELDPETRQWVVRFLIDAGTPDGIYNVEVRITHRDGRVELTRVSYTVDTQKPVVEVRLLATETPGQLEIHASQVIGEAEVKSALAPEERRGSIAELRRRYPDRVADLRRVEVRLGDGTVIPLDPLSPGELRAFWTPKPPITGPVKLHVVAVDKALNQTTFDADLTLERR